MPRLNRSTTGALTATQVLGGTKLPLHALALLAGYTRPREAADRLWRPS